MLRRLREKWSETEVVLLVKNPLPSLRKQPTFGDATIGFPEKWRLRDELRISILMTCHYQDLGRASDWLGKFDAWYFQSEALLPRSVW